MYRYLVLLPCILGLCSPLAAQSLSGIHVGDRVGSSMFAGQKALKSTRSGPFNIQKWRLEDGNDLSATSYASDGQVVYVETDWNRQAAGAISDFGGFVYGKTTLNEIESKFGSRGILFRNHSVGDAGNGDIVRYNSYAIESSAKVLATFVTRISKQDIKRSPGSKAVDDHTLWKLDALIVSDGDYAATIWGSQVNVAQDYKTITWLENGPDSQFSTNFVCPETLKSDNERDQSLNSLAEWSKSNHTDWDLDRIISAYQDLLKDHNCSNTISSMSDLRLPSMYIGRWSDSVDRIGECKNSSESVTSISSTSLQGPELLCKPLSVTKAENGTSYVISFICAGEGDIFSSREIWANRIFDGSLVFTSINASSATVDIYKQCIDKVPPVSTTSALPTKP